MYRMIRFIAAIDTVRGIGTGTSIPWSIPTDSKYYKKKVSSGKILMGYGTYETHTGLLHSRPEYVATTKTEPLREGFKPVADPVKFIQDSSNVWVLGGQQLFETLLPYADELYITQVDGIFECSRYFPGFEKDFVMTAKSKIKEENGIRFQFQVWKRLASLNQAKDVDTRED